MSRASFPFLVVDGTGAHNGLGTFVFDDTRVSNLGIQITQETAEWARNDLWGTLSMTYTPGVVADEAAVRREFDAERQREVPVKPWSALPASARGPASTVSSARSPRRTSARAASSSMGSCICTAATRAPVPSRTADTCATPHSR